MRLLCTECGKSVSTEVPDETIIRAVLKCPECIEAQDIPRERQLDEAHAAIRALIKPSDNGDGWLLCVFCGGEWQIDEEEEHGSQCRTIEHAPAVRRASGEK